MQPIGAIAVFEAFHDVVITVFALIEKEDSHNYWLEGEMKHDHYTQRCTAKDVKSDE